MDFRELSIAVEDVQFGEAKKKLPPLLKRLTEVIPPKLSYLGVSFGLTKEIYHFW
jgi:N-acetyltransferase 10